MPDYGIKKDELEIISGSIFLFASGTLSNDATAISSSIPQIVAISCSNNTNNKLTKLTTQNAYGVITITSGSSDLEQDTKLVLRYISSSDQTDLIYSSSADTLNHVLGGINTNIVYVNVPIQNNDDPFAVAFKTVAALTGSLGFNKHYSASLIEDQNHLISFSASLGENLEIGTSFKIRPTGSALHISGGFLLHSLNSGSVAVPDFSGTSAQVGGMEVGDTFVIGGGVSSEVFDWNIYQSGSGELNQTFYKGNKITSSATLGIKLDPEDKTTAVFTSNTANSGFKINPEGNIESFSNLTAQAATGSEFILKYTRDEKGRSNSGDVLGKIRWISDADASKLREGAEAASIDALVSSADVSGVTTDLIFKTATTTAAAATEKVRIQADGTVHITGSLNVQGDITYQDTLVVHITASGDISASGDMALSGHMTASGNISSSGIITALSSNITTIDGGSF